MSTPGPDPVILRERERFLAAVRLNTDTATRDRYAAVLDDFIAWSAGQPLLAHPPHHAAPTAQDEFKFVLRATGQTVWAALPRKRDGAKLFALPQDTSELPEAVRAEVRRRWTAIDRGAERATVKEARLSFESLLAPAARREAQEALAWALATIPVGGG